jgi:MoxR-like ATPase
MVADASGQGAGALANEAGVLRGALEDAARGLVEREALVELVALAAVAGEHLLVVGAPGTAKSEAVRRAARAFGGKYFEYLLGRFTEPSEIFGPVDLRKLRDGLVETETAGMLPEAEVAFLDEVFRGSTAILNTLLGILNERIFRRGHTNLACPLRVCVGAANQVPEDEALTAFADRFLLQAFLEPVPDAHLEHLLAGGAAIAGRAPERIATVAVLDALSASAKSADLGRIRPQLAHGLRMLRKHGVALSDRRMVRMQKLIAAAAALAGRAEPTEADLWPIVMAVPSPQGQALAREILGDFLAQSENGALAAAALEASLGPLARAQRIASAGEALLSARPTDAAQLIRWQLALEGVAREIDAGFSSESMPARIAEVRAQLVAALGAVAAPAS